MAKRELKEEDYEPYKHILDNIIDYAEFSAAVRTLFPGTEIFEVPKRLESMKYDATPYLVVDEGLCEILQAWKNNQSSPKTHLSDFLYFSIDKLSDALNWLLREQPQKSPLQRIVLDSVQGYLEGNNAVPTWTTTAEGENLLEKLIVHLDKDLKARHDLDRIYE